MERGEGVREGALQSACYSSGRSYSWNYHGGNVTALATVFCRNCHSWCYSTGCYNWSCHSCSVTALGATVGTVTAGVTALGVTIGTVTAGVTALGVTIGTVTGGVTALGVTVGTVTAEMLQLWV